MKTPPGLGRPREIMQEQVDEACQEFNDLSTANKDISEGLSKLVDTINRAIGPKKLEIHKNMGQTPWLSPKNGERSIVGGEAGVFKQEYSRSTWVGSRQFHWLEGWFNHFGRSSK
ncbi:hypothetical protein BASA82_001248 [Batrachochytrium salamandrivorans]|nr:hypothetical protein BASA82_001248 [Batrachochytrium salamandrivorans]